MSFAERDGVRLYWEQDGSGDPVLLIMGLGMNATGWWRTIPVLAGAGLRVLAFDNRGVGRSDRPPGPYSVPMLADDAVAILDAAGEDRAHVYGISLGGMIAQEVVLRHPERVRALVLGATWGGGDMTVPAGEDTLAFFRRRGEMPAEEAVWASVPYNYSPRTRREHGERIAEDIAQRLRYPVESAPYLAQLEAAMGHDAGSRLPSIAAPTLIVQGEADVMVPPANGERLAAAIPGAEHRTWPDTAHLFFTDEPEVDRYVAEWLRGR
jgi:pimeloyl-ACP methyl ester carboxylesterase